MEAGRELDALVAKKVMGWHRDAFDTYLYPPDRIECPDRYRCPFIDKETPGYSTDVAVAWTIVRKLVGDGFKVDISDYPSNSVVGFAPPATQDDPDYVCGSTISHAICLAALKAVGVDIDNL